MYDIEATFHQGGKREFTMMETHGSLQEAADRLSHMLKGHGGFGRGYINGKEISHRNGYLQGADGNPFCTNQVWHDMLAPDFYPRISPKQNLFVSFSTPNGACVKREF